MSSSEEILQNVYGVVLYFYRIVYNVSIVIFKSNNSIPLSPSEGGYV